MTDIILVIKRPESNKMINDILSKKWKYYVILCIRMAVIVIAI